MSAIPRILVVIGIVLIVIGLAWPCIQKLGLGRLPGDLIIERENFRFYFPIIISVLIRILLTLNFWLMRKYELLVDIVRARISNAGAVHGCTVHGPNDGNTPRRKRCQI
jgi:hypothetical protein